MTEQNEMQVDVNAVLVEMQAIIGAQAQEIAVLKTVNRNLTNALANPKQEPTTNS